MSDPVEPIVPAEPVVDFAALMESVTAMGAEIKSVNDRLTEMQQVIPLEEESVAPVNPSDDPDLAPPADWAVFRREVRTEAERIADERYEARVAAEEAKRQGEAEFAADLDRQFDAMADEAVKLGYLPAITDTDDANDPGKVARRELFGYAAKIKSTDLIEVAEVLKNFHDNNQHYDVATGKVVTVQPVNPGRFAPVGSSAARTVAPGVKLDYRQLHNTSLDQLARRAMNE